MLTSEPLGAQPCQRLWSQLLLYSPEPVLLGVEPSSEPLVGPPLLALGSGRSYRVGSLVWIYFRTGSLAVAGADEH